MNETKLLLHRDLPDCGNAACYWHHHYTRPEPVEVERCECGHPVDDHDQRGWTGDGCEADCPECHARYERLCREFDLLVG